MTTRGVVLDTRQIDRLALELDSRSTAVGFVGRFLDRLPDRLACFHRSLLEGKSEGALARSSVWRRRRRWPGRFS